MFLVFHVVLSKIEKTVLDAPEWDGNREGKKQIGPSGESNLGVAVKEREKLQYERERESVTQHPSLSSPSHTALQTLFVLLASSHNYTTELCVFCEIGWGKKNLVKKIEMQADIQMHRQKVNDNLWEVHKRIDAL